MRRQTRISDTEKLQAEIAELNRKVAEMNRALGQRKAAEKAQSEKARLVHEAREKSRARRRVARKAFVNRTLVALSAAALTLTGIAMYLTGGAI